jgi:hypothetical protein
VVVDGTMFVRLVANPFFGPGIVPTVSLGSDEAAA